MGGGLYTAKYKEALEEQAKVGVTTRECGGMTDHVQIMACDCGIDANCASADTTASPPPAPDTTPTPPPAPNTTSPSFLGKSAKRVLPIEAKPRDWSQAYANLIIAERL